MCLTVERGCDQRLAESIQLCAYSLNSFKNYILSISLIMLFVDVFQFA